jgi:hypothetical protein
MRPLDRKRRVDLNLLCRYLLHRDVRFGEEKNFRGLIVKTECVKPEPSTKPGVYSLSIPGKFIAGNVYDQVQNNPKFIPLEFELLLPLATRPL